MGVGVVRGESAVGVPLRRLFRYEWIDVKLRQDLRLERLERCERLAGAWDWWS
jgi:hypothetical protein